MVNPKDKKTDAFNLSAWALRNQSLILFFIVIFFIGGAMAYLNLSQKEDPEYTFRRMVIMVFWPGSTAKEVEQQILERMEQHLQEINGLKELFGYARPGQAALYVELQEGYPKQKILDSWYQVRKKISDMKREFPSEIIGPFFNDEFGDVFGSIYAIVGDGYSYAELKSYAKEIRRSLLRVPGVGKINIMGDQSQKIYIELSHAKMKTLGIDPQVIMNTLRTQNALLSSGTVHTNNTEVVVRLSRYLDSPENIANLNIHTPQGNFRLGDIAKVTRKYEDPSDFKMHYNGKEAIGLAISMIENGNVLHLGKELDKAIKKIVAELPVGIEIYQVSNQPKVVHEVVNDFMHSLMEAIAIVLLISFFSLGVRSGMVVALSIPLVIVTTFLVMSYFNISLQRVSLGALIIAIGLLVDDAIIAVEMMLRKLNEGFDKISAATFAYTSTAFPMLTGTLITILGFLPIGFAKSDAGEYTFSLFSVITISLCLSWFVAVLFTPYIGYQILKEEKTSDETHSHTGRFYDRVRHMVEVSLKYKKTVVLTTFGVFLLSIVGFGFVQKQFFPPSERPEVVVDMYLPEDAPFVMTEQQVIALETKLMNDPDIINFTSYIGGFTPRFYLTLQLDQNKINFAQVVIMTKGGKSREKVIEKLQYLFSTNFPDVRARIYLLENGPPVGYPIQFRVSGKDFQTLHKIANDIMNVMLQNPHTTNVNQDWGRIFSLHLNIDQDKARALDVSAQTLAVNLQYVLNGYTITQYREGDELIDVDARALPEERNSIESLKNINIYTSAEHYIPLDHIARFEIGSEEGIIYRRQGLPTITVQADVKGKIEPLDVANQIDKALANTIRQLPPGYFITVAGVKISSEVAQKSIIDVLPTAIALMALLLMLQLGSFQRVILVFLTAPLGLIGVVLALLIFQLPFGFVAMLGLISLAGMIMRNSVILIVQIEHRMTEVDSPKQAIIDSTVQRTRPILLTAIAAILAMIPLLKSVFWGAMAAVIMGGLLVATILTLIFLPALYAWWFKIKTS